MKVEVASGQHSCILRLCPESDDDKRWLRDFAQKLSQAHMIASRGVQYLDPNVEFYITAYPKNSTSD